MVEAVVQLITQMAGGAAATVGSGLGQEVSVMVRERLGGSERGRSAVRAIDEHPEDAEAVDELRSLIQSAVDNDPAFAGRIAAAMPPPKPTEPPVTMLGSIRIDGATMRGRNTISLGPVTFNNTKSVRLSLVAAALVIVALVALGIYGGTRLVTDHGPEQQRKAVTALSPDMVRRVVPGTGSLPGKWTRPEPLDSPGALEQGGVVERVAAVFQMGEPEAELDIVVIGFDTPQNACSGWRLTTKDRDPRGELEKSGMAVEMPKIADEMWAGAGPEAGDTPAAGVVIMRVGTVLIHINGRDTEKEAFVTRRMEALARMMADRAQQAQNGENPTAYVRDL